MPEIIYRLSLIWKEYLSLISNLTGSEKAEWTTSDRWKNHFFVQIIKFALPIGFFLLILSFLLQHTQGHDVTNLVDFVAFFSVSLLNLNKTISIRNKMKIDMWILLTFAVFKIITLTSMMIGSVFLLLFSLFAALLFSKKTAYLSIVVNAIICLSLIFLFENPYKEHQMEILGRSISSKWLLFQINFMFVNLVMVTVIIYIIDGFESTILKAEQLSKTLQLEVEEKTKREKRLQEALSYYKSFFSFNPLPIFIYDPDTLDLKYVNKSALLGYGYSKGEFLNMKINTLLRCSELTFKEKIGQDFSRQKSKHFKKNGRPMDIEVYGSRTRFNGKWARLVIVRDVTDEVAFLTALEQKNKRMQEIAFMQSHKIRSPLTKILGITNLIYEDLNSSPEFSEHLAYLLTSAKELDFVITDIISKTEE